MENNFIFKKFDFRTDLIDIFKLMSDSRDQTLFHSRFQINSLPEFEKWMMANLATLYHDFYVVCDEASYNIIGYIYSYEFRVYDGHCKVCSFLKPKYRNVGIGALIALKFFDEMFSSYPLRKIYADIYDYNKQSLASNLAVGFVEEGCLKEHRYDNGAYHDMHICSITREKFYESYNKTVK